LKDNFKLNIPDQIVSVASIKYNYNEDIELSDRYIRYLQIHSHNTMPAFFSKTDNADEAFTNLCYYGVVGKISKESTFYNIDMIFRIWNGINFVNVDLNNVFDINFASYKLSQNQIQKLNKVIETSKKNIKKTHEDISFDNSMVDLFSDDFTTDDSDIFKMINHSRKRAILEKK